MPASAKPTTKRSLRATVWIVFSSITECTLGEQTAQGRKQKNLTQHTLWCLRPCCELLVLRGLRVFVVNFLVVVMDLGHEPGLV